jgi:electron transfer flavoprotein alpha subunit
MSVLLLAAHFEGKLGPGTARAATAANALGGEVTVLVAGADCAGVAEEASALAGVDAVLCVQGHQLAAQPADLLAAILHEHAGGHTHIAAVADNTGRDAIGRLGAKMDTMPVTEIIAVHGPDRFDRPTYAGHAIQTISTAQTPVLLTVRTAAFEPAGRGEPAPVVIRAYDGPSSRVAFVSRATSENTGPDLATARVVVAGGQSLASKDNFAMIGDLADALGGAVGATRAAVDLGLVSNTCQVGQTGKSIAPELYLAIGISGAQQHLAGIKDARKIVVVNSDPEAPLIRLADAYLVGDLFEIVPDLIERIRRRT